MYTVDSGPPALLLCGGKGQRMGPDAELVPKPMLTVGEWPLLRHIMRVLAPAGCRQFVVALGHRAQVVKDYFLRFPAHCGDFTVRLNDPQPRWLSRFPEADWEVTCVDTGQEAGTGSRLRDAARHVSQWPILVAYGDVLADVDVTALLAHHRAHGRLATVTAARPPSRFGVLSISEDYQVDGFDEKAPVSEDWVNIGFFVLERPVIEEYIPAGREVMFEAEPIQRLVNDGQLAAYQHHGYWQPVDTQKDLHQVRAAWESGKAPWRKDPS